MQCHCDDDRRIIDINEYLLDDKHHDYLYSMFSDEYVYVNEKQWWGVLLKINKKKITICLYLLDKWAKKDKNQVIFM